MEALGSWCCWKNWILFTNWSKNQILASMWWVDNWSLYLYLHVKKVFNCRVFRGFVKVSIIIPANTVPETKECYPNQSWEWNQHPLNFRPAVCPRRHCWLPWLMHWDVKWRMFLFFVSAVWQVCRSQLFGRQLTFHVLMLRYLF